MFDAETAELIRKAPSLTGINPQELPQLLTQSYTELVSARIKHTGNDQEGENDFEEVINRLTEIAETYETIALLTENITEKRPAAFVSGTAYQILSRAVPVSSDDISLFDRDYIAAEIAASLLFLASEQNPDARETAYTIKSNVENSNFILNMLGQSLKNLCREEYDAIINRAEKRLQYRQAKLGQTSEEQATLHLYEAILEGVELLVSQILAIGNPPSYSGRFENAQFAFSKVLELSNLSHGSVNNLTTTYPGPQHLATLLMVVTDVLENASIQKIAPPNGVDNDKWKQWLSYRAKTKPILWPNHRQALANNFHETGTSAIMILPTGAGKTTLSEVKIAGNLARGKNVIFLAPTNSLVEQLQEDLSNAFPEELIGSSVSSDFDLILQIESEFQPIEVMTPEKCLALLNFVPEAFTNVGLFIFDECHMLSPTAGSFRRALDGMLCILAFQKLMVEAKQQADFLFLSAMVDNAKDFAEWIESFTQRPCIPIDLVWKPSRQARGIITYPQNELDSAKRRAFDIQKEKETKNICAAAKRELKATPHALFGLHHNWQQQSPTDTKILKLLDNSIQLSGALSPYKRPYITANANTVAYELARHSALSGLKTIVFVNKPADTFKVAGDLNSEKYEFELTNFEQKLWSAIVAELGGEKFCRVPKAGIAAPHSANLINLERRFAESTFRREDGRLIIVATPTLAQGMNLPAQIAILAGDYRFENDTKKALEAHELLNAAGRAGRAGHLANGVVFLIPARVLSFDENDISSQEAYETLRSIMPSVDRCVSLTDPLETVLDKIQTGEELDKETIYTFSRFTSSSAAQTLEETLKASYVGFRAKKSGNLENFEVQINAFKSKLESQTIENTPDWLLQITTQSGLPLSILSQLKTYIEANLQRLPEDIEGWITWAITWLKTDTSYVEAIFSYNTSDVLKILDKKTCHELENDDWTKLKEGLVSWINGHPLEQIENILEDGDINDALPKSRALATKVVPYSLSYFLSLVAQIVNITLEEADQTYKYPAILECLSTALQKGFNTVEKLSFATLQSDKFMSRVEAHIAFNQSLSEIDILQEGMGYVMVKDRMSALLSFLED